MGYVPDDVIAAMRGSHSLGIFFRMDTNPALHLWMGINDIPAEFDHAIDLEGTVYLGGGRLGGIPTLEVLINGVADRVEFQMTGISPEDAERFYRWTTLGYKVGRIDAVLYHCDHWIGPDSSGRHQNAEAGRQEWRKVKEMDKKQLLAYISTWEWLK